MEKTVNLDLGDPTVFELPSSSYAGGLSVEIENHLGVPISLKGRQYSCVKDSTAYANGSCITVNIRVQLDNGVILNRNSLSNVTDYTSLNQYLIDHLQENPDFINGRFQRPGSTVLEFRWKIDYRSLKAGGIHYIPVIETFIVLDLNINIDTIPWPNATPGGPISATVYVVPTGHLTQKLYAVVDRAVTTIPQCNQNIGAAYIVHNNRYYSVDDAIQRELVFNDYNLALASIKDDNPTPKSPWNCGTINDLVDELLGVSMKDKGVDLEERKLDAQVSAQSRKVSNEIETEEMKRYYRHTTTAESIQQELLMNRIKEHNELKKTLATTERAAGDNIRELITTVKKL